MVDRQMETNMCIDVGIMEKNFHATSELRDGIECTLVHDRLIGLGLPYVLVCHNSKLVVVKVYRTLGMNVHSPRIWY
jgi:hypothetical protein